MKQLLSLLFIFIITLSFSQDKFSQLENLFIELKNQNDFNGNILIAENGKSIFKKSYGVENESKNKKLTNKSIFCLASITKQFTATTIVLLEKEQKIKYTDKLSKYYPELAFFGDITIHNLLTHTSGIPDYIKFMEDFWDKKKIATNKDVIGIMIKHQPKTHFKPNEKWEYSNTNYMLLASIVEKVSNETFDDFLHKHIFNPFKMSNTFIYSRRLHPKEIDNMTIGYSYSDSLKKRITPDDLGKEFFMTYLDGIYGGGRLFSTTEDLLKWDRVLYSELLLSKSDKEKMFTNYKTNDGKSTNYGYGWKIENNSEFGKTIKHGGRWGGYITYIERHLNTDKTIIILQNMETDKTKVPTQRLRNILYNKIKEVSLETLKKYAGKYKTKKGAIKEVFLIDKFLYVPMNPEIKLKLLPTSKTTFIVDGFSPTVSYEFLSNEIGEIIGYRIKQEGTKLDHTLIKTIK